jgi:hypothetical protein
MTTVAEESTTSPEEGWTMGAEFARISGATAHGDVGPSGKGAEAEAKGTWTTSSVTGASCSDGDVTNTVGKSSPLELVVSGCGGTPEPETGETGTSEMFNDNVVEGIGGLVIVACDCEALGELAQLTITLDRSSNATGEGDVTNTVGNGVADGEDSGELSGTGD